MATSHITAVSPVSGFGLAMAAEFVEAMKGDIKVSWRNGVIYFTVTG